MLLTGVNSIRVDPVSLLGLGHGRCGNQLWELTSDISAASMTMVDLDP